MAALGAVTAKIVRCRLSSSRSVTVGSFAAIPRRNPSAMSFRAHARQPRPHNPLPESPIEVLVLFTGAMAGASLCLMSTGALTPFFTATLHLGQTQLGWILAVQLVGSVAATCIAGLLTDRFGDRAVVFWSGTVMGLALIGASLVENYVWLICWLLVYGIGYAAATPAGSHAIIFFFRKADRGLAMGVRMAGVPIAGAIGAILLPPIAVHFQYRGALAAAGFLTVVSCSIASLLYREPHELAGDRISMRAMLVDMLTIARDSRLVFLTLTSMVLICAQFTLMGFFTLTLVHRAGYSLAVAVGLFTLAQVAAIGGRFSWGWVSDRFFGASRALPLALACVLVALVAFAVASMNAATPLGGRCGRGRARIHGGRMDRPQRPRLRRDRRRAAQRQRARRRTDVDALCGLRDAGAVRRSDRGVRLSDRVVRAGWVRARRRDPGIAREPHGEPRARRTILAVMLARGRRWN